MNVGASIVVFVFAVILAFGAGYGKGSSDAKIAADLAMSEHLRSDTKAENQAKEQAQEAANKIAVAQAAASAAYEKGKQDAEKTGKRVVTDLRAGGLVLRDSWSPCRAGFGMPEAPAATSEPDASTSDREESAGRIVQAAAQCDAQVRGLQESILSYTQPVETPPTRP